MRCSVYIVCPSVLSCSNFKLHQTLEVKNIFKQENTLLQLTFNPGLTLTGFRTTRPRCIKVETHEGTRPCDSVSLQLVPWGFYAKGVVSGTVVPRTVHTKLLEEQVAWTCPKNSGKLVWIRTTRRWDQSRFLRLDFDAKMARSHDETCPRDLLQGLVPSRNKL